MELGQQVIHRSGTTVVFFSGPFQSGLRPCVPLGPHQHRTDLLKRRAAMLLQFVTCAAVESELCGIQQCRQYHVVTVGGFLDLLQAGVDDSQVAIDEHEEARVLLQAVRGPGFLQILNRLRQFLLLDHLDAKLPEQLEIVRIEIDDLGGVFERLVGIPHLQGQFDQCSIDANTCWIEFLGFFVGVACFLEFFTLLQQAACHQPCLRVQLQLFLSCTRIDGLQRQRRLIERLQLQPRSCIDGWGRVLGGNRAPRRIDQTDDQQHGNQQP